MSYPLLNPSTVSSLFTCAVLAVSLRVLMQRPAPGVALARAAIDEGESFKPKGGRA